MHELFQLLDSRFHIDWDPEILTKDFPIIESGSDHVVKLDTGEVHWQFYTKTGIYFARNFHKKYPDICIDIANKIQKLQSTIVDMRHQSSMIVKFLQHNVNYNRVTLIRTKPGTAVNVHFDNTRNYVLNIGVKNSNTYITNVYSGELVPKTYINQNNIKYSYRMSDGDVYLINTGQPHSLDCVNPNDLRVRYIITYSIW